jgi:hypothetical protein
MGLIEDHHCFISVPQRNEIFVQMGRMPVRTGPGQNTVLDWHSRTCSTKPTVVFFQLDQL